MAKRLSKPLEDGGEQKVAGGKGKCPPPEIEWYRVHFGCPLQLFPYRVEGEVWGSCR